MMTMMMRRKRMDGGEHVTREHDLPTDILKSIIIILLIFLHEGCGWNMSIENYSGGTIKEAYHRPGLLMTCP